jgi:hypothetical protein
MRNRGKLRDAEPPLHIVGYIKREKDFPSRLTEQIRIEQLTPQPAPPLFARCFVAQDPPLLGGELLRQAVNIVEMKSRWPL